jgi:putative ABC transport system permease protein
MLFDAAQFCLDGGPCVLVIAVLIALIGTWFPARRIARLYPVEVLYGR